MIFFIIYSVTEVSGGVRIHELSCPFYEVLPTVVNIPKEEKREDSLPVRLHGVMRALFHKVQKYPFLPFIPVKCVSF